MLTYTSLLKDVLLPVRTGVEEGADAGESSQKQAEREKTLVAEGFSPEGHSHTLSF